jgi:autotransporter-associated beta strand protein
VKTSAFRTATKFILRVDQLHFNLKTYFLAAVFICSFVLVPGLSPAQTNFATLIADGAWTWFNDPRAIFHNGALYFGYVRSSDGRSALNAFNLQSSQTTNLWASSLTQTDDHDVAGLLAKQDGTLLAIYSRHQSDQFFTCRLSANTNPVSTADWGAERTNNTGMTVGVGMTYANPFQLTNEGGKIYNFARYINYNPNVFTSTNGGTNWSTPQILIQTGSGSTRPYVKYCSDYNSRIDILYTDAHPDNYTNSLYHVFYQSNSIYKTDGTFLKSLANIPLLHDSGERGSVIYQYSDAASSDFNQWIATGRAWCWEIAYQTNGAPACVFQAKVDNVTGSTWADARIYYYYARWTGTNWQKRFIAQAGRPLYNSQPDYGGGIGLDPQDVNTIYISTDAANPFDLSTVTNVPLGNHYEIWRGVTTDGGLTFNWQAVTTNSTVDNLRPYVPRRFDGEPCVLWFRGTYTSYTSFSSSIVGLFTTQVPQTNAASGTWNVDTDGVWSDNTKWLNGILATGAGNTADFNALDITADRTVTLDSSRTLGTLRFSDTSGGQSWLVSSTGGAVLTLNSGSSTSPSVVVNSNTATLQVTLAGTNGFTKSGPGTLILAVSNSLTGALNLDRGIDGNNNDGATRITSSSAVANFSSVNIRNTSVTTAGGATLQLDGSAGGIIVTQNISAACRNNNTTPTFESLAGTNTLAGTNFVQAGGTNVIYQADAGSLLQITAALQYVGTQTAARTFTFTGAGDMALSGAVLVASNNATPISLMKTGAGTLTLAGANTYTNGTMVLGGTLNYNGSVSLGRITVSGGALGGTGMIGSAVAIQPGGILSPGNNAIGALTVNNTLTNTGTVFIRLNKSGAALTNSTIKGVSTFSAGGMLSVTNLGAGIITVGDSFKLFYATNFTGGFTSVTPVTPGTGLVWNTNGLASSGVLSVALGAVHPQVTQTALTGTNFIFSGSGGAAGYRCSVLGSTNLALPLASWPVIGTGVCDGGGAFSFTNNYSATDPQRFYVVHIP